MEDQKKLLVTSLVRKAAFENRDRLSVIISVRISTILLLTSSYNNGKYFVRILRATITPFHLEFTALVTFHLNRFNCINYKDCRLSLYKRFCAVHSLVQPPDIVLPGCAYIQSNEWL